MNEEYICKKSLSSSRNSSANFEFARQIALRVANSTFRAFEMRRATWQSNEKLTKSLEYSRAESQTSARSRSRLLLNASYWRSISILVFEKKFIINLLLFLLPPSTKPVQLFADTQNSCWTCCSLPLRLLRLSLLFSLLVLATPKLPAYPVSLPPNGGTPLGALPSPYPAAAFGARRSQVPPLARFGQGTRTFVLRGTFSCSAATRVFELWWLIILRFSPEGMPPARRAILPTPMGS